MEYARVAFTEGIFFPEMYFPLQFDRVWDWFLQYFWKHYSSNGFSAQPIPYTEIEAWSRLMHTKPTDYEVKLLKDLCFEYRVSLDKKRPRPRTKGVVSEVPVTSGQGVRALLGDFNARFKAKQEAEAARAKEVNGASERK